MLATYASAVLALLLLWNVYPKDFDYGAAAGNGLLFYSANVGQLSSPLTRSMGLHVLSSPTHLQRIPKRPTIAAPLDPLLSPQGCVAVTAGG